VPLSFSVVVNTLDRADVLQDALTGLMQQRHRNFEVIIVNGPSRDTTASVLARFPQARLGACDQANLAVSRNVGVAMARGEIIAFLDDDAVPEPGWLQGLEAGYTAPDIGGVGGFIRDATGRTYQVRATVCDRHGADISFADLAQAQASLDQGPGRFLSPTGANVSYRREALLEVGGFDETFGYFLDETDVNLRLADAGWRLTFVEGADVHHKLAASAERDHRNVPRSLYRQCRSKAYFAIRHASAAAHPGEILERLGEHGLDLYGHNRRLAEDGLTTPAHRAKLDDDVKRGLRDGLSCALDGARPLLSAKTLAAHADGRFKPIRRGWRPERLRIAFVSQQYPPGAVGGIAVWTQSAAQALAALGHEVSVITAAQTPSLSFQNGVWVDRVAPHHDPGRRIPPLPDLPAAIRDHAYAVHDAVERLHTQRGLDLVSWPIWDLEGLAIQSARGLPNVLSLHTTYGLAAPFKPDWREPAYRRDHVDKIIAAESAALQSAPFILANSTKVLADIDAGSGVDLHRRGVWTIPHGLPDRIAPTSPRTDGRIKLLFVGRLETRKGADILLDALSLILPTRPQVDVLLVGEIVADTRDASLPQTFARRRGHEPWSDRITFEGYAPAPRLDQAYADCDIFVAPSRYESFGLVFVEAMMFAKPCVGPRAGGVPEIIAEGETGLLVRPDDAEGLAQALATLIDDPLQRRAMGAAGRARYLAAFTDTEMALRLQAMFHAVVAAARPARDLPQAQLAASSE
jgi:glycosyltransferase involved in cell wall biosynthesis/GT2 family glycosyltransferase